MRNDITNSRSLFGLLVSDDEGKKFYNIDTWFKFRLLILGDPIFIDSKQEFKLDGGDDDNADADDPPNIRIFPTDIHI
jgi:hypothetical protein